VPQKFFNLSLLHKRYRSCFAFAKWVTPFNERGLKSAKEFPANDANNANYIGVIGVIGG